MPRSKEVRTLLRYLTNQLSRRVPMLFAVMLVTGCAMSPGQKSGAPSANAKTASMVPAEVDKQYRDAQTLLSVEDFEGAAFILEPLALSNPQYPAAATLLAASWRQIGRSDEALAMLNSTLAAHADYAPGWNEVGILHREAGQFAESEAAYLKAVTVNPDYALAHFNFGILLDLYLGRHKQALEHYQRYQQLAPTEDKQVGRWIADINRRLQRATQAAQVRQ